MNCKECQNLCIATPTKSGPNTGKKYWACPNHCPNIFNGWVNSGKIRKSQHNNNDETEKEELYHGVPKKRCKACREVCYATIANSGPNKGKEYWACSNRCIDTFNGWVVITQKKQSLQDNNRRQCTACDSTCVATVTKTGKNAGKEYWACPKRCKDTFNGWVNEEEQKVVTPQAKKPKLTQDVVLTDVRCHKCSAPCTIRKSKTVKNPNREFYVCSGGCKKTDSFNGWVNNVAVEKPPKIKQHPSEAFFIAVDDPDQYGLF